MFIRRMNTRSSTKQQLSPAISSNIEQDASSKEKHDSANNKNAHKHKLNEVVTDNITGSKCKKTQEETCSSYGSNVANAASSSPLLEQPTSHLETLRSNYSTYCIKYRLITKNNLSN